MRMNALKKTKRNQVISFGVSLMLVVILAACNFGADGITNLSDGSNEADEVAATLENSVQSTIAAHATGVAKESAAEAKIIATKAANTPTATEALPTMTPTIAPTITPSPATLWDGLAAYWPLDGLSVDGKWHDLTDHDHHLAAVNAPVTAQGKMGTALDLLDTEGQYLQEASSSLRVDQDFSWAGWIFPRADTDNYILSKYKADKGALLSLRDGRVRFWVYGSGGDDKLESTPLDLYTWHFVCAAYSRGEGQVLLQVDGNARSKPLAISIDDPGKHIGLGVNTGWGVDFWNGLLDEFGWWGRALNAGECDLLYNDGAGTEPPLVPQVCAAGYTRLKPGDSARVTPGLPNRVRTEADTDSEVIAQLDPGSLVKILEGPVCADGLVFWKVENVTIPGDGGWTAEGDGIEYWLEPAQSGNTAWGWQEQFPKRSPSPRKGVGMVYDARRKVVVLAGGTDWKTVSNETWEFDGVTWQPRKDLKPFPKRSGAAMAFDTDRQVTVLFGGNALGNNQFFNDTWEYDGEKWVQRHPSQSPPARNGTAMAYDLAGKRMLLFGGYGRFGSPPFFDDTWEYVDGEWRQLNPDQHPSARETALMVYDSAHNRLVLFGGGHDAGSVVFNDTWEWDGENWIERKDLPVSPPARWAFFMAYDEACQRVVLFGGLTGTVNTFNDTWTYDGSAWKEITTEQQPVGRWDGGMVYDYTNQRMVLFGGQYVLNGFEFLADTWVFTDECE
jgi:hypothetical protein